MWSVAGNRLNATDRDEYKKQQCNQKSRQFSLVMRTTSKLILPEVDVTG